MVQRDANLNNQPTRAGYTARVFHSMKTTLLFLFLSSAAVLGQTTVTNYVTAAPTFREVNGQLYNIEASRVWHRVAGKVKSVQNGGLLVFAPQGNTGNVERCFVVNYEDKTGNGVANGDWIETPCMRAGVTNVLYRGNPETFELWDCGKPHVVAVITTNAP